MTRGVRTHQMPDIPPSRPQGPALTTWHSHCATLEARQVGKRMITGTRYPGCKVRTRETEPRLQLPASRRRRLGPRCQDRHFFIPSLLHALTPSLLHSFLHPFTPSLYFFTPSSSIHSFTSSCLHFFTPSLVPSFLHYFFTPSFIPSVLYFLTTSLIHSFTLLCLHSFISSLLHSFLHSFILVIPSLLHSFAHSFLHSFTCSLTH